MSRFFSKEMGVGYSESSEFYAPHAWLNVIARSGAVGRAVGHRSVGSSWESHVIFDGSNEVSTVSQDEVRTI